MRKLYALKNFTSLDAASKKAWHTYLKKYQGPHGVILFESKGRVRCGKKAAPPKKSKWIDSDIYLGIELPDTIDMPFSSELFSFFYEVKQAPQFVRSIFSLQWTLGLNDVCRLMAYQPVVDRNSHGFFAEWYSKLVVSEASLFTLSQHFLGRNPKMFLRQWKACKDDSPPEFWVAYWSEQIWQAAQYVTTARKAGVAEVRKGFYRLPLTFLNSD